jgi:hypothetical protein
MQQQIQIRQSPEQCLAEASAFFARRRAKVSDRSERGLRFGLEGSGSDEGGRVTVAPGASGATTVTVEAEGLGVMAIAEGFIRELRKQAKDADRLTRDGGRAGATLSAGFADLRQRLGMPEPAPASPPPPAAPAAQAPQAAAVAPEAPQAAAQAPQAPDVAPAPDIAPDVAPSAEPAPAPETPPER